jgi:hypothetical protein
MNPMHSGLVNSSTVTSTCGERCDPSTARLVPGAGNARAALVRIPDHEMRHSFVIREGNEAGGAG